MADNEINNKDQCCASCRGSKKLVVFIVFVALFVDCLLLTVVVPIIPNVLPMLDRKDGNFSSITNRTRLKNITESTATLGTDYFYSASDYKVEVGLLLGSKVLVQLIANPIVGFIVRKYGFAVPMNIGFVVTFLSTIGFAFGNKYWMLLVSRAIQGVGSSCASVAGMGMLAATYTDDKERGKAMSIALSGMAVGVMLGPPYGGIMYEFTGKELPFISIAVISLFDGCLRLCVLQTPQTMQTGAPSFITLLKDPYVLIVSGGMIVSTTAIAVVEPTLPIWMHESMNASAWQQGAAFISMTLPYVIGTNLFGCIGNKIGRWLAAMLGLLIIAVGLATIPLATNQYLLIPPLAVLGLAIGMVGSSLFPTMGYLVDIRQLPSYADAYALADSNLCLGFLIGPAISGVIFRHIGFNWLMWIEAILNFIYIPLFRFRLMWIVTILNFIYIPLFIFLRDPKQKSENTSLIQKDELNKQLYGDEEMYCRTLSDDS